MDLDKIASKNAIEGDEIRYLGLREKKQGEGYKIKSITFDEFIKKGV